MTHLDVMKVWCSQASCTEFFYEGWSAHFKIGDILEENAMQLTDRSS